MQVLLLVLSWNYLKSIVTDLLNANIMKIQSSLEKVSWRIESLFLLHPYNLGLGNPFLEEDPFLVHIFSKNVLVNASSESFKSAKETGKQQFLFVTEHLKTSSASLYDNIKENNLALCWYKNDIVTSKNEQKIISWKTFCRFSG